MEAQKNDRLLQNLLFTFFALSGFSGLIYESIWSHYLKLFLGHAAYAQTLVLALFMGGMAGGATLVGRCINRLRNPLMAYAAVEVLIGFAGLFFHRIFEFSTGYMLDSVLPGLESPLLVELLRWMFAAMLILPQTILLGATFPLMSVGLLRAFSALPGSSISLLYFTNSIGAVVGVLASGFLLISAVGLPGTILMASLVNFVLAIGVYSIARRIGPKEPIAAGVGAYAAPRVLLCVALITGLSSFIYEVAWIRMLVLVLGASTHAFELMLSAFILGLALGGLWVRNRIDRFSDPVSALAWVQILMGMFALTTVVSYNHLFTLMQYLMLVLQKNDAGYFGFNIGSHLIAMLVMLPVTFMAGMTLPLITCMLYKRGGGEASIGRVYAFNTLGAIAGVALTAQILLPFLGLKLAITFGAGLDLLLGIWMLALAVRKSPQKMIFVATACIAALLGVTTLVDFDYARMASGVFRRGEVLPFDIIFHRDGRTATVDVFRPSENILSISTNGKPDASIAMDAARTPPPDEPTQLLLGALPLLFNPSTRNVAVVGMGCGLSASIVLTSPAVEQMDLVEIERSMVDGARLFGQRVAPVFEDPRSRIHIDDAKSYFAVHNKHYDAIISEPSNPWVSGVANLFSDEFYRRVRGHLNEGGLLVQWFQLYEMDRQVISSILTAVSGNFDDYVVYASNNLDMILVAKKKGKLTGPDATIMKSPRLRDEFRRVGWLSLADIEAHRLGDKKLLDPLFKNSGAPMNSDYFPFVDQHAVAVRFKQQNADFLLDLQRCRLPLPGPYFETPPAISLDVQPVAFPSRLEAINAQKVALHFSDPKAYPLADSGLTGQMKDLITLAAARCDCRDGAAQAQHLHNIRALMNITLPRVSAAAAAPMLGTLRQSMCVDNPENEAWMNLYAAVSRRDMPAVAAAAELLLAKGGVLEQSVLSYLVEAAMLAYSRQGNEEKLRLVQKKWPRQLTSYMELMAGDMPVSGT